MSQRVITINLVKNLNDLEATTMWFKKHDPSTSQLELITNIKSFILHDRKLWKSLDPSVIHYNFFVCTTMFKSEITTIFLKKSLA